MRTAHRSPCRRFAAFRRRARAFLLRWVAAGAAIDEAQEAAALDERELAVLTEAIARARRAGR